MIVSRDLVFLGTTNKIHLVNDKGEDSLLTFARHEYGLFSNHQGTAIYSLPLAKARNVKAPAGRGQGKKLFRTWHGFDVEKAIKIRLPDKATTLYKAGYVVSILYTSNKWDGKPKQYIHEFKGRVRAYVDRTRKPRAFGFMAVNGKRLVMARGIIG